MLSSETRLVATCVVAGGHGGQVATTVQVPSPSFVDVTEVGGGTFALYKAMTGPCDPSGMFVVVKTPQTIFCPHGKLGILRSVITCCLSVSVS